MNLEKINVTARALMWRMSRPKRCPSCGSLRNQKADRKGPFLLLECEDCALKFRWPVETAKEMERFYQAAYEQAGLTTDLPNDQELTELMENNFRGSSKDFSKFLPLFKALDLKTDAKILDFGANWGYSVFQFNQAGYKAVGYELSKPRALFAKRLGVKVETEWDAVKEIGPFDLVFSSHVVEHTPDPAEAIKSMLSVLTENGVIVSVFPNGSSGFAKADPRAFHSLWGIVHPIMLNDKFLRRLLPNSGVFVGCLDDTKDTLLECWNRKEHLNGTINKSELLLVAQKS